MRIISKKMKNIKEDYIFINTQLVNILGIDLKIFKFYSEYFWIAGSGGNAV